jgi:hypothetical protein
MSQPYVHGITDTLTHDIASSLTAGHTAADGTRSASRWSVLTAGSRATSR